MFDNFAALFKHSRFHDQDGEKCKACLMAFDNGTAFDRHKAFSMCYKEERFDKTVKKHLSLDKLKVNLINHGTKAKLKKDKTFTCKKCAYVTEKFKAMFNHHCTAHQNELDCIICEKKFDSRVALNLHYVVHGRKHYCSVHFEAFGSREEYFKHIATPGHDLKCGLCSAKFKTKEQQRKHMSNHKGEFRCKRCPREFAYRGSLARHIKTFHENKMRFLCPQCGKVFTAKTALASHISSRHEERKDRPFQCEFCGKSFFSISKLRSHYLKHSDSAHFCDFCILSFETTEKLAAHIKEKNHQYFYCSNCPAKFKNKSWLTLHLTRGCSTRGSTDNPKSRSPPRIRKGIHYILENNLHVCTVCNKEFKCQGNFYRHYIGQHTDIKNYKCKFCPKVFGARPNLVAHLTVHDLEPRYKCSYCGKQLKHSATFYKHTKACRLEHDNDAIKSGESENSAKSETDTDSKRVSRKSTKFGIW